MSLPPGPPGPGAIDAAPPSARRRHLGRDSPLTARSRVSAAYSQPQADAALTAYPSSDGGATNDAALTGRAAANFAHPMYLIPQGDSKPPLRVMRMPELERRTGLKSTAVYARLSKTSKYSDETFPRPVPLAPKGRNSCYRKSAVGFVESEVEAWLAARLQDRDSE